MIYGNSQKKLSRGCGCNKLAKRSRRKSPSAGWAKKSPKKRSTRRKMKSKCGNKCFLQPNKLAYPICEKGSCKVSCKGIHSAYSRARQWKKSSVSAKAKKLLKSKCKYTPKSKRRSKKRSSKKKRSKKRSSKKKSKKRCKFGKSKRKSKSGRKRCLKSKRRSK